MKRLFSLVLCAVLLAACLPLTAWAAQGGYKLVSDAVVLMDADTGEVLWKKNKDVKLYPASITKVLTGLLVAENCAMSETAVTSSGAAAIPKGYAHVALQEGDRISVDNAMYAMMLASANDAANVLAEHAGGSQRGFAAMMNSRARELGAVNSNFVNPHGMPHKSHYTTAYDMALITQAAAKNPTFFRYFSTPSYLLPSLNSITEEVELESYQFMLLEDKDEYDPRVTGGKIGYTPEAGHTMVTVAEHNGRTLICVVLGSNRDGKYEDTKQLLNYGFRQA